MSWGLSSSLPDLRPLPHPHLSKPGHPTLHMTPSAQVPLPGRLLSQPENLKLQDQAVSLCRVSPIGVLKPARHSLGPEAHAETGEVAIGEGEGGHEDDEPGIVRKDHSQVAAGMDVAQQQQGHEHQPGQHQAWQPAAVLPRL